MSKIALVYTIRKQFRLREKIICLSHVYKIYLPPTHTPRLCSCSSSLSSLKICSVYCLVNVGEIHARTRTYVFVYLSRRVHMLKIQFNLPFPALEPLCPYFICGLVAKSSQVSSGLLQTAQTWANAGVCGGLCTCAVGGTFD